MLASLRKTANQGLTVIIFGAIILVFALNFGPGSVSQCGSGRRPEAATVNGRVISEADFSRRYAEAFQRLSQSSPQPISVEQAKAMNLKATVLDQMIGDELLAQEAERRGLVISTEELKDAIMRIPSFQTDGKFDRQKYAQYAKYMSMSEAKFEEDFARQLLVQKMYSLLMDLAVVSPSEVREAFDARNNRADVEFVRVDPAFYRKDLKLPEDAAKKLLADDMKAVEEYYTAHATRYNEPRRVRARHILAKVSENAPEADVEKARAKVEAAKKRVDGGEDFAKVAKEVSEDSSAGNGGDLGLQGPGAWVKPFEDEANRLKPGEVGNVIRSRFGFHLIKVEEVKDATKKELKDVQDQIAKTLVEERAVKASAKAYAEKLLAEAKAGKSLEELVPAPAEGAPADPLAPKADNTGWFTKGSRYVPRLGVAPEIVTAVFATTGPGPLDKVFEVNDRFYVVRVQERELPDPSKFEAERTDLEEQLAQDKRRRTVSDFIKERVDERKAAKAVTVNPYVVSYDARPGAPQQPVDDF